MNAALVKWSEEKQIQLHAQLTGTWVEDAWPVQIKRRGVEKQDFLRFEFPSPSLNTEFKYALRTQFTSGKRKRAGNQNRLCTNLRLLARWLHQVAPSIHSLVEKNLDFWEASLRTYLVETKSFTPQRHKYLKASQVYAEIVNDDARIYMFRQIYRIIADAYDDRRETDKDTWDMRKLNLSLNLTKSAFLLY